MSAAKWATPAAALPYGFRVTIERTARDFTPEQHVFRSKTPRRAVALQAATYKQGFVRVLRCEPLTREEWDRAYPARP